MSEFEPSINIEEFTVGEVDYDEDKKSYFWAWFNGRWTVLELYPGEAISLSVYQPHEEGFNSHVDTWEHHGEEIRRTTESYGRDCDGVLRMGSEDHCPVSELPPITWPARDNLPKWRDQRDSPVFDQFARAAGY